MSLAVSAAPTRAHAPKTTKHHEVKKAGHGNSAPNLSPVVPSQATTMAKKASSRARRRRSQGRGRKWEVVYACCVGGGGRERFESEWEGGS
jgi:hypothetical protein